MINKGTPPPNPKPLTTANALDGVGEVRHRVKPVYTRERAEAARIPSTLR